jgi:SAM-dependent methyltransferase
VSEWIRRTRIPDPRAHARGDGQQTAERRSHLAAAFRSSLIAAMPEPTAFLTCRACGFTEAFRIFEAREMLHGTRHRFTYGECPQCASLQIREIPQNLPEYYPSDYYSLQPPPVRSKKPNFARLIFARWLVNSRSAFADRAASRLARKTPMFAWCRLARAGLDARILDLGCGTGGLLRRMQRYGFSDLTGFDPYTPVEADEPGFRVRRAELSAVTGAYDLIMMHHVLEHLIDPLEALRDAKARLSPDGKILVRIPVADSRTWKLYREHWFNLDPPRHLLVPSVRGMEALAARASLSVAYIGFDGTELTPRMSEHYRNNVPYSDQPYDSAERMQRFRREAQEANRDREGDQGVFLLSTSEG